MNKLSSSFLNKVLLLLVCSPATLYAVYASGGNYELTKTLVGGSGVNQVTSVPAGNYDMAYALGEDVAGAHSFNSEYDLVSGYFSGYASGINGKFDLIKVIAGPTQVVQNGVQVGVPLNAKIQLVFSSIVDSTTITNGLRMSTLMDHMGQAVDGNVTWSYNYDQVGTTVTLVPQGAWQGNTLYDITGTSLLQSVDGFALDTATHGQFITVLDPAQENVVLQPIPIPGVSQSPSPNAPSLNLDIPQGSLTDYSYVLVSQDPVHSPLRADPNIIQAATQKGIHIAGAYQTPLALQEIAAFNVQGKPVGLSKGMSYSVNYSGNPGILSSIGVPVRPSTLSLWALDTTHSLWVKMPDTHPNNGGVLGPVSQFSVFALMGSPDGNASSSNVFPVPWRPHGPQAGDGPGQTGSEAGGITFNNLPSECTIKIYTISGEKIRELHHSDLTGPIAQEKWDGKTSAGDYAASGVYLWRVQSSTDGKNGKLMIIR